MASLRDLLIVFLFACSTSANETDYTKFPPGFTLGAATAAYQIEGAINEGGRGKSIWDTYVNQVPSPIKDNSSGEYATLSYYKYKEDIQLVKETGFDQYRFSISWTRILPTGEMDNINQEGIDYYNKLINEATANNIVVVVTIYHWDLPQPIQDIGGWANPLIVDYYVDFAYICFKHFGDRVKIWITINEPSMMFEGYKSKSFAPGIKITASAQYVILCNILKAHAKAYRLYQKKFKKTQKGKVGITCQSNCLMARNNSEEDKQATKRAYAFDLGMFAHPIFTEEGDWPPLVKEIVNNNSILENRRRSRLPVLTADEINYIRGSSDFLGLNHYTSRYVTTETEPTESKTYYERDQMVKLVEDPSWPSSDVNPIFKVVPSGLRGLLNHIKDNYGNPPVLITENGYGDNGIKNDTDRIRFFHDYLSEMLKAIYIDNCNITGYTIWSLIDNFEWSNGYTVKFGIYSVDFDSPNKERTKKASAHFWQQVCKSRQIPNLNETMYFDK